MGSDLSRAAIKSMISKDRMILENSQTDKRLNMTLNSLTNNDMTIKTSRSGCTPRE